MAGVFEKNLFKGYVVFISGGGSGIGLSIAESFAKHGAHIALFSRNAERLKSASELLQKKYSSKVLIVSGDVREYAACERAIAATVAEFGHLDVLVNNAAGNFLSPLRSLSSNAFRAVLEIDLLGSFHLSRAAYAALSQASAARPAGCSPCIVNITATLHYGATHWQGHPAAAKAGVDALTRAMALEWGNKGVRANGVAPGPIKGTEGMQRLMGTDGDGEFSFIPLGRMGDKEDVAMAVLFLASPAARFVSGTTLVVDGGACLYKPPMVDEETIASLRKAKM